MRRALSTLLCLLLVITAFPSVVFGADTSYNKEQFVKTFLNVMQKSIQTQEKYRDFNNGMTLSVNGSTQDFTVCIPDEAIDHKNISAKGEVTLKINPQDERAYCGLDAAYMDKNLRGEAIIDGNRMIVTEESIRSIDNFYPLSESIKEANNLTNLPEYLVLVNEELGLDWNLLLGPGFSASQDPDLILKVIEELIRIIPQQCFSYSEGYYVFEYEDSILVTGQLLYNLKQNKESITEAFANCLPKMEGMSDEEYSALKQNIKEELLDSIDSLSISDLAKISDIGITIEKFGIKVAQDVLVLEMAIKGNSKDLPLDKFTYNSINELRDGKTTQKENLFLAIAEPQNNNRFDLNVQSTGVVNGNEFNQDLTLQPNVKWDNNLVQGNIRITINGSVQKPVIDVPALNDQNSIVIKNTTLQDDNRWNPWDPNEIDVLVNGSPLFFEDAKPIIVNDRVLAPLRALAAELNCTVNWEPPQKIKISDGAKEFYLTIDSNEIVYNSGETKTIDAAPTLINGRTYVPMRSFCEEMGMEVEWDAKFRIILIFDKEKL